MRCFLSVTCCAILMLLLGACGLGVSDDDWPQAGIHDNTARLGKTAIGECCYRGGVTAIQLGDFNGDGEDVMAVLGQTGLVLFDPYRLTPIRTLEFEDEDGETLWFGLSPYLLVHQEGFQIAMLGGGYGEVGLLDSNGKPLWLFRPDADLPPAGMLVDDAPGREARFYVTGHDGTFRLDTEGEVVWQIDESADYLALVADGEVALATASHGSGTLKLWTADGQSAGELALPVDPDGLAFVRHGEYAGFVVKSGRQIVYLDRSGSHLFSYRYDETPVRHGPEAALVAMNAGEPPQLAVRLASSSAVGRSVLTLFSLDGARLYEEYLDSGRAIGVLPGRAGEDDRLLVGESADQIWVYARQAEPASQP